MVDAPQDPPTTQPPITPPPAPPSEPASQPVTSSPPSESPSSPPGTTPLSVSESPLPPPEFSSPPSTTDAIEPPFPIKVADTPKDKLESSPSSLPPSSSPPPSPPEPGEPAKMVEPIFKRFLPMIIGFIVLILLIFLITKVILPKFQKPKTPANITLKYWGLWEPESLMAQIIKDYQADNSHITIQYIRQSSKDYRERLQSALAKGDGPDIFRWHNTWLPMLKNDLSPVPATTYSPSDFGTIFYPIVKQDAFYNNNYYGIPLEFDALALYINEDIFQQNPTLKVPTTWDNLRQTAFKLKVIDPNTKQLTRGGVALGTTSNVDHFSDILGLMILQNGGDPGKPEADAVISAMKFYTLFSTQDKSWNDTLPNSTHAFATSKVAMMLAPSWRAIEVNQLNPQLSFKLYPVPQLPGTNIAWATYWMEGVAKKSANTQAAWDFIKYLSSQEVLTKLYSQASQTRLFGEPYPRQDMASSLQQDPYVGAILSQAISAQSYPLVSRTLDNGLNDRLIKYYKDAINSYHQNLAQKNITEALSQGVNQVLSQYGLTSQ